MPEMMNMKRDKEDDELPVAEDSEGPKYPWGLELRLSNEEMEKLGMSELPDVGEKRMIMARVEVSSIDAHEHQGDDERHQTVGLQITDMAIGPDEPTKSTAERLYGSNEG